jgi:hypothetical protein
MVLAGVLIWSLRRHRDHRVAGGEPRMAAAD